MSTDLLASARIRTSALVFLSLAVLFVVPGLSRSLGAPSSLVGILIAVPLVGTCGLLIVVVNQGGFFRFRLGYLGAATLAWLVLLCGSMLRSNHPAHGTVTQVLLALLWASVGLSAVLIASEMRQRTGSSLPRLALAVTFAAGIFAAGNVVLHWLGVEPPRELNVDFPEGRLAALLGLRLDRTLFPMASGVNNHGIIAGLGLSGTTAVMLAPRSTLLTRIAAATIAAGCIVSIVYTDSRGALLFGLLAGAGTALLARFERDRHLRILPALSPALPIILLLGLSALSRSDIARTFSRQQGDVATATGRTLIWAAAGGELVTSPSPTHLVGYGQYGPKGNGISAVWAGQFKGFQADATLTSTHNMVLQVVYDLGYLGLILLLALTSAAIAALAALRVQSGRPEYAGLIAQLVYITLAGTTEATVTLAVPEVLVVLSLTFAIAVQATSAPRYTTR